VLLAAWSVQLRARCAAVAGWPGGPIDVLRNAPREAPGIEATLVGVIDEAGMLASNRRRMLTAGAAAGGAM